MKTRSTRLAPAPADPTPPPREGAEPAIWCRGFGTHALYILPPMVIMPDHTIRVQLGCHRCASVRTDRWHPKHGAIEGRHYNPTTEYRELLDKYARGEARVAMIGAGKPQPLSAYTRAAAQKAAAKGDAHATDSTALRLVSKGKRRLRDKPR